MGLARLLHEHGGVRGPQAVWQAGGAVAQDVLGRQDAALDRPKAAIPWLQLWQGTHGTGRRGQLLIAVTGDPAGCTCPVRSSASAKDFGTPLSAAASGFTYCTKYYSVSAKDPVYGR